MLWLSRAFHLVPFVIAFAAALVWYILYKATKSETMLRVAIAFDQVGNAMMGGSEDETVSSRLGRKIEDENCVVCRGFCKVLSFVFREKFHCKNSIGV